MLKKLQIRFIFLTTVISIIVIFSVAFAINIFGYVSILNGANQITTLILNDDLKFEPEHPPHNKFNREIAFTTRFFEVELNFDGNISSINSRAISSVSEQEIVNFSKMIFHDKNDKGVIDNFRFMKSEHENGYTYIFLDLEKELFTFEKLTIISTYISIGAIIAIFILSCIFSKKAVLPIATSYEKQKQFITDVSHELKTPLAIIKADNEVTELDYGETEWTNSIKMQISRLDELVENLVTLTRLDEQERNPILTDFSLSDALSETIAEFSGTAQTANLKIISKIESNISYTSDENAIRKLFYILIENAIKYAVQNTDVNIILRTKGSNIILCVENACENLEKGKYNHWFERFYRADSSRNSSRKGFGIGLSIAKSICDRYDIKISAICETENIVRITVVF